MAGIREMLAVVLGVIVGGALLLAPRTLLKVSVFVGPQRRRRGDYGTEAIVPDSWVWGGRLIGVICVIIALYIAQTSLM